MPQLTRPRARQHLAQPPQEPGLPPRPALDPRRWLALAVILTASLLGVLDFFIVNIAIPSIQKDLNASDASIELMIAGYGLTYAVLLITGGRLGDIYGRKRMFLCGAIGFTLASTLCGLAPTAGALIAARILQGITGAVMFPQVLSIIQVSFPPHERSVAFGIFGVVMGLGSFIGNVLGGFLIEANLFGWSWRPVFLVNLPVGIVALSATAYLVHESRSSRAPRLDLGGVILATAGLFLFIDPLVQGREAGWPLWTFVCLAASIPVLVIFVWYERWLAARGGAPLLELGLFHDRVFVAGLFAALAFYGGLSAFFLSITLFVQKGLGFSPRETGFTFAPFALGFLLSSSLGIKWTRSLGSRAIKLGAILMILGLTGIVWLARTETIAIRGWEIWPLLMLYGIGQGFITPTLISIILSGIPSYAAGSASGVLTTVQQIALAIGVAIIGTAYFSITGLDPRPEDYARAIGVALLFNISLLVATFVLAFLLPNHTLGPKAHRHLDV